MHTLRDGLIEVVRQVAQVSDGDLVEFEERAYWAAEQRQYSPRGCECKLGPEPWCSVHGVPVTECDVLDHGEPVFNPDSAAEMRQALLDG